MSTEQTTPAAESQRAYNRLMAFAGELEDIAGNIDEGVYDETEIAAINRWLDRRHADLSRYL